MEVKAKRFIILEEFSTLRLSVVIDEYLSQGWELLGEIKPVVVPVSYEYASRIGGRILHNAAVLYVQAMVRKGPVKHEDS